MAGKKTVINPPKEPKPMCSVCGFRAAVLSGRCQICTEERDRIMVQVLSALIMHGVHHAEEQVVRHAYKWADVCMRIGRE